MNDFMTNNFAGIVLAFLAAVIVLVYFLRAAAKKKKRFKHRDALTTEQIRREYFADENYPPDAFDAIWNQFARDVELPAMKLRPADRFDIELAPARGYEFDDPVAVLLNGIASRLKKAGEEKRLSEVKTVRDYIALMMEQRSEKSPRP